MVYVPCFWWQRLWSQFLIAGLKEPYLVSVSGGKYCGQTGLTEPSGDCNAGYYCSGNSSTAMPSGVGGDQCQAGYYCPAGAYQPITCDPGSYCAGPGLSNTSGLCLPGYYCSGGAYIPNPTDGNVTGVGHFHCGVQSILFTVCHCVCTELLDSLVESLVS